MSLDIDFKIPNPKYKEWEEKYENSLKDALDNNLNGLIKLIDEYYKDRMPDEFECVGSFNITHNLNTMAKMADIYKCLWRPEEIGYTKAHQLIADLRMGLRSLKETPEYYNQFNASNGWGKREHLVSFVEDVLECCEKYPNAEIEVSR